MIFLVILSVFSIISVKVSGDINTKEVPGRIAGGNEVSISDYPFTAAVLSNEGTGAFTQKCAATILTTTALMSAASCYTNNNGELQPSAWFQVRVGSSNANSGGALHTLNRIVIHENFNSVTYINNVAVLRTSGNIVFVANSVAAAFIPGLAFDLREELAVYAVGWGAETLGGPRSEVLRATQVWVVNQALCVSRYEDVVPVVIDSVICASWLDVGIRGQCEGDEGGPLVLQGSPEVVVGIHSWSEDCPSHQHPPLNTRVSSYTSWIILHATLPLNT